AAIASPSSVDQRLDNVNLPIRSGGYPPPDLQQFTDSISIPSSTISPISKNSASSPRLIPLLKLSSEIMEIKWFYYNVESDGEQKVGIIMGLNVEEVEPPGEPQDNQLIYWYKEMGQ
ncbi:MAG: hypothetical protein JNJ76_02860, partial [Candidatus Competibacter sp.]|nr:hypothetical protein [Candidatus Competibacter sp.]